MNKKPHDGRSDRNHEEVYLGGGREMQGEQSELTITLSNQEREALRMLAKFERRTLNDQVCYILRRDLERRGLLPSVEQVLPSIGQDGG
jgi:hypothetical protein